MNAYTATIAPIIVVMNAMTVIKAIVVVMRLNTIGELVTMEITVKSSRKIINPGLGSEKKMKIKVESYSITGLTQKEFDLICTALCHFPTTHPRSREVFGLLEKFATVAAVMSKEFGSNGRENNG